MHREVVSEIAKEKDWRVVELPSMGEQEARYLLVIPSVIFPAMMHLVEIAISDFDGTGFQIDELQVSIYENIRQALALTNALQVPADTSASVLGGAYSLVLNEAIHTSPTKAELETMLLHLFTIAERYPLGLSIMKLIVMGDFEEAQEVLRKHST